LLDFHLGILIQTEKEMKVSELNSKVGNRVMELTNGLQKSTSRNENITYDWNLW
jgi:hypothetical protein